MKPTYEQLEAENRQLRDLLKRALERITELERKVEKLEKQLGLNSKNSSKPPSQDQKGNTPEKQEKKEREKRDGKSRTPYPPERVDKHVECSRTDCPHCKSTNLTLLDEPPVLWQQVELPPVQAIVTQFECQRYQCEGCGKRSIGSLPEDLPFSSFGPKLMALVASLTGRFHMAKREAILLINDLMDLTNIVLRI